MHGRKSSVHVPSDLANVAFVEEKEIKCASRWAWGRRTHTCMTGYRTKRAKKKRANESPTCMHDGCGDREVWDAILERHTTSRSSGTSPLAQSSKL